MFIDTIRSYSAIQKSHQNTSGRILSLPSIMGSTLPAVVSGRRASSPSPHPGSPANISNPSSPSQQPQVATTSHASRPTGRFSDAFASFNGRSRALSIDSDLHSDTPGKQKKVYGLFEENMIDSSFGIGELAFRNHYVVSIEASNRSPVQITYNIFSHPNY